MAKVVLLIDGPDTDNVMNYLLGTVCEIGKPDVVIWIADNPDEVVIPSSSLSYMPKEV